MLLSSLSDYTHYHFREEAQLMRRYGVNADHQRVHLQAHSHFIQFLQQARAMAGRYPEESVGDALTFLAQWLLSHINVLDQQMGDEIRRQREQPGSDRDGQEQDRVEALSQLSEALGRRTFEILEQKRQLLDLQGLYRALLESATVLIHSHDEKEMLQSLCKILVRHAAFHVVWVGRPGAGQVFEVLALAGSGAEQVRDAPPRLDSEEGSSIVVRAWNTQQAVVCNDTLEDVGLRPWHAGFRRYGWKALLAAPVFRDGSLWAILALISSATGTFDGDTVALCIRVAELLGRGLDEQDLHDRLVRQESSEAHRARHDVLTDLPNRLALLQELPQAIARARRHGTQLAVGMIDLDDFKPVNDTFGHATGDELLRQLASRLQSLLRTSDLLVRLGGDEFVVVFEDVNPATVMVQLQGALDRLHSAVETPFDLGEDRSASIQMSLGVALFPDDGVDADALLREADAAMYAAKSGKSSRDSWWLLRGHVSQPDLPAVQPSDADGPDATALLRRTQRPWEAVTAQFVEQWYADLMERPATRFIIDALDEGEVASLKNRQEQHLRFLLSPDATEEQIATVARHVGGIHAQAGVTTDLLVEMMVSYQNLLKQQWIDTVPGAGDRLRLLETLNARLHADMRGQLQGHGMTIHAIFAVLNRPLPGTSQPWMDTVRQELAALAEMPGIQVAALLQPDIHEVFQFVHAEGPAAQELVAQLRQTGMQPVLDNTPHDGQPLVVQAWRSARVMRAGALRKLPDTQPWAELLGKLGIRSALAIPVQDTAGRPVAVLLLDGSYHNQFETSWAEHLTDSLRIRWNQIWREYGHVADPLPQDQVQQWRQRLFAGGLEMWVQPVVDLRTGGVVKTEALARLRLPSGELIMPGQFLPLLGEQELRWLFGRGLQHCLQTLCDWDAQGMALEISLNLPIQILHDPQTPVIVAEALQQHGIVPGRLTLELLEGEEFGDLRQTEVLRTIAQAGVQLAVDDLGSGYSSILRLSTLPFRIVKIDQSLVLGVVDAPLRVLAMVNALNQMGHDLGLEVVVEGLETPDLIEMAIVLGVRYGQGYGIARPMPAGDLPAWVRTTRFPTRGEKLQTALGALAWHWHFQHGESYTHPTSLQDCPLTAFLEGRGPGARIPAHAHARLHAGEDMEHVSLLLTEGLVALVQQDEGELNRTARSVRSQV